MASNSPMVRQISWISAILQLSIIGLLAYLFELQDFGDAFFTAACAYAILAFTLRSLFAKAHRNGIRLIKRQEYSEALPFFEDSVDYFSKNG